MTKSVLIYGGCGALGRQCVELFKAHHFQIVCVDLTFNDKADLSIVVNSSNNIVEQSSYIIKSLSGYEGNDNNFQAIICVAGGWAGGSSNHEKMIESVFLMEQQSLWSSAICAHLAAKFLANDGCLVLTGASAALGPTPAMLGYGMCKAAVHQLTKSLAKDSTLPARTWVAAILPITLDTPANRKNMPDGDFSSWTPLAFVANLLLDWVTGHTTKPISGSLVQLTTTNYDTAISFH